MATYKMLKTQRGVKAGDVHPSVFHEGKTYDIDDDLAGQFGTLDAIEESSEEPVAAVVEEGNANIHENWLDTNPAVLRHGELTAKQVVAKDESAHPETTSPAEQEEGKAEGDEPGTKNDESGTKEAKSNGDAPENKSKKSK